MKQITNRTRSLDWLSISIALICMIFTPICLHAKELDEQEVRTAVETWVRHITADARPDAIVERMEPHKVDGKTVAYIAHLSGSGFCLCGADELVLPVYFYSPQGTYDSENPSHQYILWEIDTRSKKLQKGSEEKDPKLKPYEKAFSERAAFWQDLSSRRIPTSGQGKGALGEPAMMELNLTSRWDQHGPYNNYCPMGDGGRCDVGCVATAVAQVMKYWNWPPCGTGSKSYTWNGDQSCGGDVGGGTLSATFSDPYDWQNMPDVCWGCSQVEKDALAELCYEVGIALEMDYGWCGSKAYSEDIDNALLYYFRYYDAGHESYWNMDQITKDIQWLRPVVLCGRNAKDEGHCWVVFGYDKGTDPNRQFKMNMGWGWDYDDPPHGWYSFDNIPKGLIYDRHRVTRIAPLAVKFVGAGDAGDGSPHDPYKNIVEAVAESPDGATLIFKAGSVNTFSVPTLLINRPLTLKGKDVMIHGQ